jgi:hypothetical protein
MRRALVLFVTASLAVAVAAGANAGAAMRQCQSRTVGPGSLVRGGKQGAACMLAAFENGCKPAEYLLSSFGVDTAATEDFRIERRAGICDVNVITSFRVIPQTPHVFPPRTCRRIHRLGADVVADRCTAGEPAAISLIDLR